MIDGLEEKVTPHDMEAMRKENFRMKQKTSLNFKSASLAIFQFIEVG
jgi:hypothetical protein